MKNDVQSINLVFSLITHSFICVNSLSLSSASLAFKAYFEVCFKLRIFFSQGALHCCLSCVEYHNRKVCKCTSQTRDNQEGTKTYPLSSVGFEDLYSKLLRVRWKLLVIFEGLCNGLLSTSPKCTAGEASLSVVTVVTRCCLTWSQLMWLLKEIWNVLFENSDLTIGSVVLSIKKFLVNNPPLKLAFFLFFSRKDVSCIRLTWNACCPLFFRLFFNSCLLQKDGAEFYKAEASTTLCIALFTICGISFPQTESSEAFSFCSGVLTNK